MARTRKLFMLVGAVISTVALTLDYLVPGDGQPSVGPKQWVLFGIGIGVLAGARLLPDAWFRRGVLIPALVASSTYLGLLACEVALAVLKPPPRQSGFVRGLYTPDPVRGYS